MYLDERGDGIGVSVLHAIARVGKFRLAAAILAVAVLIALVSAYSTEAQLLEEELQGIRHTNTSWQYVFEIGGLTTPGVETLALTYDLHYDAMPDLHEDRGVLEHAGKVIVEFDVDWFCEVEPDERIATTRPGSETPDWVRVVANDGPALGAIFASLPRYPTSFLDFERLPSAAKPPLTMRVVSRKLVDRPYWTRGNKAWPSAR